jgi:hypothetical protein
MVLLTLIAITAAGCSGCGHGAITTTTRRPVTLGDTKHPDVTPCPTRYKDTALAKLNADVPGASNGLVPFVATEWSICQWDGRGRRTGESTYVRYDVGRFVRDTNRLARSSHRPQQNAHPRDKLIASQPFYLVFVSGSQQIVLRFDPYGDVTNGYLVAQPTCGWEANFLAISCVAPPG